MAAETTAIHKQVTIGVPIERAWQAIGNAEEFGRWFGIDFAGQPLTPGADVSATITDPPEYAGVRFPISVVAVEPPRRLAFRWHPGDPDDPESATEGPTTLVEFILERSDQGTLLTLSESGFDAIPADRRARALASNDEGWSIQVERIRNYLQT